MQLSELIGIGRYRECYAIANTDLCLKRLKPIGLDFRLLSAHLLGDINQDEFEIIKGIPAELKFFFPQTVSKNGKMLISKRPKDFNGQYSKPVLEFGKISNPYFWDASDFIVEELIKHKLWLFDVFHLGNNILVQKLSESKYIPVIIDCKRSGYFSYPLQANLIFDAEKEKKLLRRHLRFKEKFKPGIS